VNFDEHAHAQIVAMPVLAALGKRLGVRGEGAHVHAGLQHTYGYLLSTLATPFGYKRARWVDGEIERGLGLPAGLLGPTPVKGTLYANVTCLLTRMVFPRIEWRRAGCADAAAPEIVAFEPRGVIRLEETAGPVTLRSDWVQLDRHGSRYLFIYSVDTGDGAQLLTCFTVDNAFLDPLRFKNLGRDRPIAARYNAYVPALPPHARGRRRLTAFHP
jgi:hypothetical protein